MAHLHPIIVDDRRRAAIDRTPAHDSFGFEIDHNRHNPGHFRARVFLEVKSCSREDAGIVFVVNLFSAASD
jgi:hypothetical protein